MITAASHVQVFARAPKFEKVLTHSEYTILRLLKKHLPEELKNVFPNASWSMSEDTSRQLTLKSRFGTKEDPVTVRAQIGDDIKNNDGYVVTITYSHVLALNHVVCNISRFYCLKYLEQKYFIIGLGEAVERMYMDAKAQYTPFMSQVSRLTKNINGFMKAAGIK